MSTNMPLEIAGICEVSVAVLAMMAPLFGVDAVSAGIPAMLRVWLF